MGTTEQEVAPLTEEQKAAIKACRFSTCTLELGWMWTDKDDIVAALDDVITIKDNYLRDSKTKKREWELRTWNPNVMAFIRSQSK